MSAYTLITVTYGGEVSHSRGYETLEMCENAKSVALTGLTVDQNREADERYNSARKKAADDWRAAHPPRQAKTNAERLMVVQSQGGMCGVIGGSGPYTNVGSDGLLYDWPASDCSFSPSYNPNNGDAVESVRGQWVRKYKNDVKFAQCVIEPTPGAPKRMTYTHLRTTLRASRVGRFIARLGLWYLAYIFAWFVVTLVLTMYRMWPG